MERNYRMKIYMVSLLHRATINSCSSADIHSSSNVGRSGGQYPWVNERVDAMSVRWVAESVSGVHQSCNDDGSLDVLQCRVVESV